MKFILRVDFLKDFRLFCTFLIFLSFNFSVEVFSQNQSWERAVQLKAKKIAGDYDFVSIHDIAEILKLNTYYSNKVRKAILYLDDNKVIVTAFNPFVLINQTVLQMPVATRYADGDILVPVKFFLPVLKRAMSGLELESGENGMITNIASVQVEEKANGTFIRINTTQKFPESNISTRYSRQWLYLDILGGQVNPETLAKSIQPGLVTEIVPLQLDEMVQLSFKLNRDISEKEIKSNQSGNEIWVSIPSSVDTELIKRLKEDQAKWRIDTIIIDPGHGGKDPGTIGYRGTYEKDVVLAIAKKLKKLLEKESDVKVLMTREDDTFVPLEERTHFANKNQGKLFVSIHANWNRNGTVTGAATYFLGLAKSEESLEIAQRENSVIKYNDSNSHFSEFTEEQIILASMAQNAYNKESQDFAAMIQDEINKRADLRDRGVKQAGFYVMVGASMPNVLVETAFMSNKQEEKLLNTSSFQQKIAEGIYQSIKKFKEKYEWSMANR